MTTDERLAILAHELGSPVAALDALATAARDTPASGLTRVAELAATAGHDIERLLSDLDVLSLRREEVDLRTLVEPLAQLGVTCNVEPARVVCDPTRIRQALANLVANGLRHGTAVHVTAHRRGDRVVVDVTDDGPGVPAGMDVFALGVSGAGSSGYGLWLAREIAEAHRGTLTLRPGSAGGATFTLEVPSPPVATG
jgi:signal transduction histidine kinase